MEVEQYQERLQLLKRLGAGADTRVGRGSSRPTEDADGFRKEKGARVGREGPRCPRRGSSRPRR